MNGNDPITPVLRGSMLDKSGLTKREHFAALAMQGMINEEFSHEGHELTKAENVARRAVRCADALIVELNKQPQP